MKDSPGNLFRPLHWQQSVAKGRRVPRFKLLFTLLLMAVAPRVFAGTDYWQLTTDRLTVITNGSATRCTKVATRWLAFDKILRNLANSDEDSQLPQLSLYVLSDTDARRVFLSAADKNTEAARNMQIFSKYLPAQDFDVAAIVDSGDIETPLQSVLLIYSQSLLTSGRLGIWPLWYSIGVANLTNGAMIHSDGSALLSRDGPFVADTDKSASTKFNLASMLDAKGSDLSAGNWTPFMKLAREWAQYGLLTTPERKDHFRQLAALMRQGTPADMAVSQAFGMSLDELSKEFQDGHWKREVNFTIPAMKSDAVLPMPEKLESAQADKQLQVIADRVASQPSK